MVSRRKKGLLYVIGRKMAGLGREERWRSPSEERKEKGRQKERDGKNHIYLSTNKSICYPLPSS